nr:hypothetical protein [Bacteroidota bacterium]
MFPSIWPIATIAATPPGCFLLSQETASDGRLNPADHPRCRAPVIFVGIYCQNGDYWDLQCYKYSGALHLWRSKVASLLQRLPVCCI